MARILSFDQSSKCTGWCLTDDETYISSGVIKKDGEPDIRIGEMGIAICNKIKEFQPDCVIIENVQQQSGVSTVILLARLQGFILGWCYVHNIRVEVMGPSQWRSLLHFKQGAGTKRKELKQQSIDYVKNTYDFKASEDESEAICINDAARIKYFPNEDDLWGE